MAADDLGTIQESVGELARRAGITPDRAFAAWYAINFFDVDEDLALEAAELDGPGDQGIDFLFTDNVNERVILLQGHYPKNPKKAAPVAKINALTASTPYLDNPEKFKGRPDVAKALVEAAAHRSSYDFLLGVVSLGPKSNNIASTVENLNSADRYKPYRFFHEGHQDIRQRFSSLGDDSVKEDTIIFDGGRFFEDSGEYGRAFVGSVSAAELHRLYNTYGDVLFSKNVRLYLGARKGGINDQIVTTAGSSPGKFWALNNGITIVADSIKSTAVNGKFLLRKFSIVNGCQTTVSLSKANAPSGAKVLTRLVAANQSVVNDIVMYNNTQNAVRIWTVRAGDAVQRRLRAAFDAVKIEYAPKPDNSRQKSKTDRVIQLDRLAQFLASRLDIVIEAVKEKSELFDRLYQRVFPHDISAESAYLAWILGISADEARQVRLSQLREQDNADDSQTQLLGVAGTYWIVHCAAKFIEAFNSGSFGVGLEPMKKDTFRGAVDKYVSEGLDAYINIAIDTFTPEDYTSLRQALRSPKFLQKIDQKLAHRIARFKTQKRRLPVLNAAFKSAEKL